MFAFFDSFVHMNMLNLIGSLFSSFFTKLEPCSASYFSSSDVLTDSMEREMSQEIFRSSR